MTQEELCDGICSVVMLSRIETGGAVKRDAYARLMERMGRVRRDGVFGKIIVDYYKKHFGEWDEKI